MPTVKSKISIVPITSFEAGLSTYIDPTKYELVAMNIHQRDIKEKFGKKIYGEWCCPLKMCVAMGEQVVVEKNVKKIIGLGVQTCHYPFVLGNTEKWIKKKFGYYPIESPNLCLDLAMIWHIYKQLNQALPEVNFFNFIFKASLGIYRALLAHKMQTLYLKTLPLTKNPKQFKLTYNAFKKELIKINGYKKSRNVYKKYEDIAKQHKHKNKPKFKILLTGDFSLFIMEFFLFELDTFLAKHNIEIIQPFAPATSAYLVKYSKAMQKAKELLQKTFSNKHNKINNNRKFIVEQITLTQIFQGLEENVDGIIYVKPIMCTPCDNISYVLKEENNFGKPLIEISYDEHSGINGIVTRLEAFINIIKEQNYN